MHGKTRSINPNEPPAIQDTKDPKITLNYFLTRVNNLNKTAISLGFRKKNKPCT